VSTVQYYREAYVDRRGDGHGRIRITLDREITAAVRPDGRRLYASPDVELIPQDWMVESLMIMRLPFPPVTLRPKSICPNLWRD